MRYIAYGQRFVYYIILQVNINPAYQSDELKHTLTLADVKCLMTLEKFKTKIMTKYWRKSLEIFGSKYAWSSRKYKIIYGYILGYLLFIRYIL